MQSLILHGILFVPENFDYYWIIMIASRWQIKREILFCERNILISHRLFCQ